MTLQIKVPCLCNHEEYLKMHPLWRQFPKLCIYCNGAKEMDQDISLEHYQGEFHDLDWQKIEKYQDDIYVAFKCQCGDEINFSEGGYSVCKCGRVYRLSISLHIDETHVNDQEYFIAAYQREQEERWSKFKESK